MNRERRRGPDGSTSPSRHRLCRRQAALHGASGAARSQTDCPQRHRATNHRMTTWRVTELYGAQWRRRRRNAVFLFLLGKTTGSSTSKPFKPPFQSPSPFRSDLFFNKFQLVRNTYVPCARKKTSAFKTEKCAPRKAERFLRLRSR